MTSNPQQILEDALALPAADRAVLAEKLLRSLDRPDAPIDAAWAAEAENRIDAYERRKMKAIPAEEVFSTLDRP